MTELSRFRREYGRLCVLIALALQQGHSAEFVTQAARGEGNRVTPVYHRIRRQRRKVYQTLEDCRASDVEKRQLVEAGLEARRIIEEEFMVKIPSLA